MSNTAPLTQSMDQKRAERLRTIPISRRGVFERAYAAKAAPRSAIKAFCLECLGFDEAEIRNCTAPACPLYEYRPYCQH